MLSLFPGQGRGEHRLSRRQWLAMSSLAVCGGAGSLAQRLDAATPTGRATAKHCIYIFLCGGPSQPDLWDLKPAAPDGIRTVFKPIASRIPGVPFGELIPRVAGHADKLALIRSLTHTNNDHNGAIAHSLLGQLPGRLGEVHVARDDHPGLGGILHKTLGASGPLPAWVVLPRPFTTYSPPYKGQSGGFLGSAYDPLMFHKPPIGSLSDAPLRLDALSPLPDMTDQRQEGRWRLRQEFGQSITSRQSQRMGEYYEQAFSLLSSPTTRAAFDLDREPLALRERYGTNEYGQSFLMARRLVESGVRFVNVFWTFFDAKGCQFNLWDNHGVENDVCGIDGQLTGLQQLTHKYCTPSFDQAFSALLEDLEQRGLLDETLIVVAGEFGRTPHINKYSGRDHWAHCYTQLLAGGGVRGGQVYGASDATGAYVKDQPVTPEDFAATVLHAFGVAPETQLHDITGRPLPASYGTPLTALF